MKKILHIIDNMGDGGAQRVVLDYLEHKSSLHKYELACLSLSCPTNSEYDKYIKIQNLPVSYLEYKRSEAKIAIVRKLLNWIRRTNAIRVFIKVNNVDAIHTHMTGIFYYMILIFFIFHGEKFHTMHADPYRISRKLVLISRFVFRYLDVHPIAVSEDQRKKAMRRYGLSHCDLVRNGVDIIGIKKYVGNLDKKTLRKKYGIPVQGFVIGSVGRLHFIKNFDLLIKIFDAYKKHSSDDVYLAIVGNGPEEGNLKKLIFELGVVNNVFLIGNVAHKEVYEFYKMIDIFMLLSQYESSSIVTLEAQAVGVRCLLSNSIPADVVYKHNVRRMDVSLGISEWCAAIQDNEYINRDVYDENTNDFSTVIHSLEYMYNKYF